MSSESFNWFTLVRRNAAVILPSMHTYWWGVICKNDTKKGGNTKSSSFCWSMMISKGTRIFIWIKLATRKWKGKRRVNEKGFGCCRNFKFLLAGCSTTGSSAKETDPEVQEISVSLPAELTTLDTTQTTDKVTFTVIQHLLKGRIVLMKRVSQFPVWRRKQSSVKMARHIPLN